MKPERPHFQHPFTRSGANVAVVEQDTIEHVHSCEYVIVCCPLGFRDERPEFGWPFPEFATIPIDSRALATALHEFEPRGRATAREWVDEADAAVQHLSVTVEV